VLAASIFRAWDDGRETESLGFFVSKGFEFPKFPTECGECEGECFLDVSLFIAVKFADASEVLTASIIRA
jgi:hypothetical protein